VGKGNRDKLRDKLQKKNMCEEQVKREYKHMAEVLGPLACAWAAKLDRWNRCPVDAAETMAQGKGVEPKQATIPDKQFRVTGEPLYRGKGKRSGLTYNYCDIVSTVHDHAGGHLRPGITNNMPLMGIPGMGTYAGLNQPLLASDSVVLGEDKTQMCRKNKQQRQALRAEQPLISPWTWYQGMRETLHPTDHTACPPHQNSMCPTGRALQHPAADLLQEWATFGCPTKTGKPWLKTKIWEAVARGPHCLALSPEAIAHFAAKASEKVQKNQARLVQWDAIKDNSPKELKILPIVAIPHNSKDF
jgi:hypothetical protein